MLLHMPVHFIGLQRILVIKQQLIIPCKFNKVGGNWSPANTVELAVGNNTFKSFFVGEFNRELIKYFPSGSALNLEARVKADVGNSVAPIYSNVTRFSATPYRDIILYSFPQALNVAGNYQGWDPGSAPQLVSLANDGEYAGFINFANASPEFKFVKGNNWGAGDFGGGSTTLTNGGSNLKLNDGAGIYYVTAKTGSMTWTNYKLIPGE
jgi:hypothetical protein